MKKHMLLWGVLVVMLGALTACSMSATTYTYQNDEVEGVKIEKTEIHRDKIVIQFAKDSFSKVEHVVCYGADFAVLEEQPEFLFRSNTLTIETENAGLISGLYVEENQEFYMKVRYLDSDAYAMLVYAEYDDAGLMISGNKDTYYTQEEKAEQEAKELALAEKENSSYGKLVGTWMNESETVSISFFSESDEDEKFVRKQPLALDIEDEEYEAFIQNAVHLSDGETVEKAEWIEENVCYRVSLERTRGLEGEYKHLSDYIFIKEDTIKFIKVTYPSKLESPESDRYVYDACDFEVKYEDVTFDGHKDITISLGHQGAAGTCVSCAYVYAEGEFVYKKSFELIPNYSINEAEKCIEGYYEDKIFRFEFEDGQFVEVQ